MEGAEVTVLDGMAQLLERSADLKLIIKFNPALLRNGGVVPLEFIERLTSPGWDVQMIEEANGLLPLDAGDAPELINRLLAADTSINLLCTR